MAEPRSARVPRTICGWGGLFLLALALSLAQPALETVAQEEASDDAAHYLERMAGSGDATYEVRQLVVYFGSPQSAAVVDIRSSSGVHFLRAESGPDVTRLWRRPGLRVVSDERGSISDSVPSALAIEPEAVLAKFEVEVERPASLLGVRVVPLALVRRSDNAAVERLWVHPDSGVVYRRELYGADGKLVGLSAILDMRWGRDVPADPFDPGGGQTARAEATGAGDAPSALPNGYSLVRGYRVEMDGKPTEHWLYSDGLHALSVFRSPGAMRRPAGFVEADVGGAGGWAGPGPGTWAWEGAGASWVLVAEEPGLDPARLTTPFPKGGPSVWARLGSLWAGAARAIGGLFS